MSDHDILIELKTMAKETNDDVKEIRKTLHGNGRAGICSVIDKHDVQITTLFKTHRNDLKEIKEQKNRDLKLLGIFLTVSILIITAIQVFLP